MFNNFALNSPVLVLSIVDSLLARLSTKTNLTFHVTNHPLPPNSADNLTNQNNAGGPALILGYAVIVSMSLAVAAYTNFLIHERQTNSKHLQMMSGLRPLTYWLTAFIWDSVCFLIQTALFMVVFALFNVKEYVDNANVALSLVMFMLLYGWANIPFVYSLSFAFKSATKGYTMIVVYNILTGMIGKITVPIIQQAADDESSELSALIFSIFFPTFNISHCFSKIYTNEYFRKACEKVDCSVGFLKQTALMCCGSDDELLYSRNILRDVSRRGLLPYIIILCIQGFIFWLPIIIIEHMEQISAFCTRFARNSNKISDSNSEV
ncbi:hypothetical protein AB6A40_006801 [Gnathostoma spinigerum]|uniref:ABC-2 type transporter transmembrane domain-containing protein n=1 Tax=Gnathostoma spinigerum TaxID=75299 RepID=A0ABD6EU62_9BILA